MAVVTIATGVTTTGVTAGVAVAEARCYSVQVTWSAGDATVLPEFSVDGTNYFSLLTQNLVNVSNTGNVREYKITDMPVAKMRINVTAISGGASVGAVVSAV